MWKKVVITLKFRKRLRAECHGEFLPTLPAPTEQPGQLRGQSPSAQGMILWDFQPKKNRRGRTRQRAGLRLLQPPEAAPRPSDQAALPRARPCCPPQLPRQEPGGLGVLCQRAGTAGGSASPYKSENQHLRFTTRMAAAGPEAGLVPAALG